MNTRIESPYSEGGLWLRGNLHTHTSASDGPLSPQDTVRRYAGLGYDFLVVSDHDGITPLEELDPCGMVLIRGNEITASGVHMLHIAPQTRIAPDPDRQKVLDAIAADGGFAVMCHPNWEAHFNHCPQETLERLQGYAGIEIFNGVTAWCEGNPLASDRWDRLLSAGRRVWGFANDDCHVPEDHGVGWSMVQAAERTPEAIVAALRDGHFYASTGVFIDLIAVKERTITVRAPGATRISVYGDHGRRPAMTNGPEMAYTVPEEAPFTYVRFECFGPSDARAWTQPFRIVR